MTSMLTIYWANSLLTYLYLNPGRIISYENVSPFLELTVKKPQFGPLA